MSPEEEAERKNLIYKCCDLVGDIEKINCFDSSITYYRREPYKSFANKSLPELKSIKDYLERRL